MIFLFILGSVVGSFLNVCIHRLPRGESVVFPASHCPSCNNKLPVLDLVPILGYLLLRGKCRHCQAKISLRYPLVEALTGGFFVVSALKFGLGSLDFVYSIVLLCLLIIIFFIDLENLVIPDAVSFGGILWGLGYHYLRSFLVNNEVVLNPLISALFGLLVGYALLYLIGLLGRGLFKKEAIGEGDLYLAALLGACLGLEGVVLSIFLSYLLAGVVIFFLLAIKKIKMGDYVPFGPALIAGGILTFFFKEQILAWYINAFF